MTDTAQGAVGAETKTAGQSVADRLNWLQGLAQSELRNALDRRKHLPPQIVTSTIVNEISDEIRAAIDCHLPGQYTTWVRGTHLGDMQVSVGVPSWHEAATPRTDSDEGTAGEPQGAWMQTFCLPHFRVLDPDPSRILIEDIAHHLSQNVRYGGAGIRFLSVAEHSVHMARAASPEHALWALLHDASETYLHDLVRPVKRSLAGYAQAEDRIMRAVCERFGLPPEMPAEVKRLDNRILIDETRQNMRPSDVVWSFGGETEPLGVTLQYWTPEQAEREFLATFAALTGRPVTMPATPAPATPPGVPDSVRALSEAASPDWDTNEATPYILGPQIDGEIDRFEVIARGPHGHAKTGDAIRKWRANRMFAVAAVNYVRSLLSAHPAGQSTTTEPDPTLIYWIESNTERLCNLYPDAASSIVEFREELVGLMEGDPARQSTGLGAGLSEQLLASAKALHDLTAPDSTRTGPVGVEDRLIGPKMTPEQEERIAHNLCGEFGSDVVMANINFAKAFYAELYAAARPAAPEAQGAWRFDMEAAPRDGTVILLWREGWGEPSAAYWGLAPMACGASIASKRHPWVFLDSTNGVNGYEDGERGPTAWHPMLDAPAPPSSGQEG